MPKINNLKNLAHSVDCLHASAEVYSKNLAQVTNSTLYKTNANELINEILKHKTRVELLIKRIKDTEIISNGSISN